MSQLNEYNHSSDSEKEKEDWMNNKWRPMMGWMYMAVCICDFIIFPILWSIHQAVDKGQVNLQWQPLTLQGAGLFHIAMGAVLGIAAYGRTKEKLEGVANNNQPMGTQYVPPGSMNGMNNGMNGMNNGMGGGYGNQSSGGFNGAQGGFGGASNGGFGSQTGGAPAFGQPQSGSFGGNPAGGFGATTPGGFGSTQPPTGSPGGFSSGFAGTIPAPAVAPTLNAYGQKVVPQATQPML